MLEYIYDLYFLCTHCFHEKTQKHIYLSIEIHYIDRWCAQDIVFIVMQSLHIKSNLNNKNQWRYLCWKIDAINFWNSSKNQQNLYACLVPQIAVRTLSSGFSMTRFKIKYSGFSITMSSLSFAPVSRPVILDKVSAFPIVFPVYGQGWLCTRRVL